MAIFFDTHAHLDFPDFAGDLEAVVQRAHDSGITKIITIGTDIESSRRAITIAERFPGVYAAAGWHPTHVMDAPDDVRPGLRELARHPKVVAIGETGLDYHRMPSASGGSIDDDAAYKAKQTRVFQQQMEVAAEAGLNCIIHQRDSFTDIIAQMQSFTPRVRGVFHCFGGDVTALQGVLSIGSMVSFTGIVTFKNAQTVRDTVGATAPDQFMLETDCPFLAPVPHRGKRCEPAYVKEIAAKLAEVRNCTIEELSEATCATALRFFPKLAG
jgi:TatD DNase family protein